MKNFVITIGREFGSGGHNLGQSLAKELGIPCYDRHLIEEAAVCGEFKMEELEEADEMKANRFLFIKERENRELQRNMLPSAIRLPVMESR